MHENVVVIFPVAKAGEDACRIGGKPYSYPVTGYGFRQNDNQMIFLAVAVWCPTFIYYMVITATFRLQKWLLVDGKAQESGSRKVSSNSPGNQG